MDVNLKQIRGDYNIYDDDFEAWVEKNHRDKVHYSLFSKTVSDAHVEEIVNGYLKTKEAQESKRLLEEKKEQEKRAAMASMLITSGFSFDGYTITKYSGYISGDDAIQIPRGRQGIFASATDVGQALTDSLSTIRRNALAELKEAAYALGCNAVIGVDFDYITLDPETVNSGGGTLYLPYVFCVTANGNAVIIEKNV